MLLIKNFHIVLVIGWVAGLFDLPRIFVNLAMDCGSSVYDRLLLIAKRLYRFASILMLPAIFSGLYLWGRYRTGYGSKWLHLKLLTVIATILYTLPLCNVIKKI